ncbi:MAG: aspartate aminotransferase [Candidatus Aenigmatarchaeota archaeon]|nr:MAG: aspartate aminotransferase [Candidatus Aenigmarchaeota archaeon]
MSMQAKEANSVLEKDCPSIYSLLSEAGRKAFFPKSGILAQTAEAKGSRYNATIGIALDDSGDPLSLDCLVKNSGFDAKDTVLYSPSYGQKALRKKWLDRIKEKNPSLGSKTTLPVVTNAITHGLSIAGRMLVDDGGKMILPDMFWGNYNLVFQHAEFDTFEAFSGGKFNVDGLREKLGQNPGKQVILLNFPNNPTGYSATVDDVDGILSAIEESAEKGNKIAVLCDDAYFGLFFEDDVFKESVFSKLAGLHENVLAVKLDGLTKEMYAWGLRVGFMTFGYKGLTGPAATVLEDKVSGMVRGSVSNVCTHSQSLALKALDDPALPDQEKMNYGILRSRYSEVRKVLSDRRYSERFEPLPFNSGYFMCIRLKTADAESVRKKLLEDYSTGLIATGDLLRIAFSSISKDKLRDLFDNIFKACNG